MRRIALITCAVALAASALASPGRAQVTVRSCGTLTIRAGSKQGAINGAGCLLGAYEQHCLPATYKLSIMGVDTFQTDTFRLTRRSARCRINVTVSFQVIPQAPRLHHGSCKTLKRRKAEVIATGCVGSGIPKTISLNPPRSTP
jgi:hypothetical protein